MSEVKPNPDWKSAPFTATVWTPETGVVVVKSLKEMARVFSCSIPTSERKHKLVHISYRD